MRKTAYKRFCKMAAEVLARIVVQGKTDGRNPNGSAFAPPLRKAVGTKNVFMSQKKRLRGKYRYCKRIWNEN